MVITKDIQHFFARILFLFVILAMLGQASFKVISLFSDEGIENTLANFDNSIENEEPSSETEESLDEDKIEISFYENSITHFVIYKDEFLIKNDVISSNLCEEVHSPPPEVIV